VHDLDALGHGEERRILGAALDTGCLPNDTPVIGGPQDDAVVGDADRVRAVRIGGLGPFSAGLAGYAARAGLRRLPRQLALPLFRRIGELIAKARGADGHLAAPGARDDVALA